MADWTFIEGGAAPNPNPPELAVFWGRYRWRDGYDVDLVLTPGGSLSSYTVESRHVGKFPHTAETQRGVPRRELEADLRARYVETLRRWGLGEYTDADRRLAEDAGFTGEDTDHFLLQLRGQAEAMLDHLDAAAARASFHARIGRPPKGREYPPEHFSEVAALYQRARSDEDLAEWRHRPNEYIAHVKHTSPSAAAKWVSRCRELGLLPPSGRKERTT
jgi:hypothetical protein